jgi:hypothetical protein
MPNLPEDPRSKIGNTFNPFMHPDISVDDLVVRIIALLPKGPELSAEEQTQREQKRQESAKRFQEARHGELPVHTYRILEQGSFVGWRYELEVGDETIVLTHPDSPKSPYQLFGNETLAVSRARAAIASREGEETAQKAKFIVMWGGRL